MKIAIGSDHAGFVLKERLRERLVREGHQVEDFGTQDEASCDYPDYAKAVAEEVACGGAERGVLVCYTGVGMSIAANKVPGVRAALAYNEEEVTLTRQHNDANVITFGAKFTTPEEAGKLVDVFLATGFSGGERHIRRVRKVTDLERGKQ